MLEAVAIPEEDRTTLCVSTQIGCPLACSFCATGTLGLGRNLSAAEIVDQLCRMRELLPERRITNVVFMGMGEPLLNLPAVVEAVRTLLHPKGFALAPRRVTVSTAGVVPRIADLLAAVPVNLAVSLHATTDALRDVLVPLNKRFPLAELLGALRAHPAALAPPSGVLRVHADGGRERLRRGRAPPGGAAARAARQGEPDPDEPAPGRAVPAARARGGEPLHGRARAGRPGGDAAAEPRRRHRRRLRPARARAARARSGAPAA